ncbi:MAG: DNA polymerase III subunit chi [Gammaproteobacteria bacterium]
MSEANTRVDFYILEASETLARLRFACRLAEKAYGLSHSIHAHVESDADARRFDELLWTFKPGSFLPHEVLQAKTSPEAPITIGTESSGRPSADLLINLGNSDSCITEGFDRIAEIIDGSEQGRQVGRTRFKAYRDAGFEPQTHQIG